MENLLKNLPANIPNPLVKLIEYQKDIGSIVSGDFELTDRGNFFVTRWFRKSEAVAKQFVIFGVDHLQSLYGYWVYEGCLMENAPIVYLGSEGSNNTILANTTEEFFELLALGKECLGDISEWVQNENANEETINFRNWLKINFNISTISESRSFAIIEKAKTSHPNLNDWVINMVRSLRNK